jgi:ABC-type multidrug transport system fused ATPase/permease subunit
MEAMDRLMRGRTTLMIAHRLSTLDICDARLEIERGRVVNFSRPMARFADLVPALPGDLTT